MWHSIIDIKATYGSINSIQCAPCFVLVMCLIQDILEGEKLFPSKNGSKLRETETANLYAEDIMSGVDESSSSTTPPDTISGTVAEDILMDEVDAEQEQGNKKTPLMIMMIW